LVAVAPTSAFAFSLSLVGGAVFDKPTVGSGTPTYSMKMGFAGGVLGEYMFSPMVGLEAGALYMQRKALDDLTQVTVLSKYLEFPFLLRYWFSPMLSIGAGGYVATGMGDITETNAAGTSQTFTYDQELIIKSDYGLVGSLRFAYPISPATKIFLDGRYTLGLQDVSRVIGASLKYNDIQALAGVTFMLMK
jgi:hypothetical protein